MPLSWIPSKPSFASRRSLSHLSAPLITKLLDQFNLCNHHCRRRRGRHHHHQCQKWELYSGCDQDRDRTQNSFERTNIVAEMGQTRKRVERTISGTSEYGRDQDWPTVTPLKAVSRFLSVGVNLQLGFDEGHWPLVGQFSTRSRVASFE